MNKSLVIFMISADEAIFSESLIVAIPEIKFIDGCDWPTHEPPVRDRIEECQDKFVYFWNPKIHKTLPLAVHPSGRGYSGPQSGCVIRLIRSQQNHSYLTCGTISVGLNEIVSPTDLEMKRFIQSVWRALNKITTTKIASVEHASGKILSIKTAYFRCGNKAAEWCLASPERFLRDRTIMNYYRPLSTAT